MRNRTDRISRPRLLLSNGRVGPTRGLALVLISFLILLLLTGCAASIPRHVDTAGDPSARLAPKENDWSRVAQVEPDSTIRVTLKTGRVSTRVFVAADESALIALNLTSRTLPRQVKNTLRALAANSPNNLFAVAHGKTLTQGHLRLASDGLFFSDRRVAPLESVLEHTAQTDVAEIGRVHRATLRGLGWGALIGAGIGLAVTLSACGTNWSQETSSCTNLTPALVFIVPMWGTLIGGAVGTGTQVSDTVYKAP